MLAAFALGVALTVAVHAVYLRSRIAQLDLHRKRLSDTMDKVVNVVAGGGDAKALLEPPKPKARLERMHMLEQIGVAVNNALPHDRPEVLRAFHDDLTFHDLNVLVCLLLPHDRARAVREWKRHTNTTEAQ